MKSNSVIESLRFENVSYGYKAAPAPVFKDLSIDLPTNTNVFVSGKLGSGQSTLLKLLAVMIQPQIGGFFINGVNTSDMTFAEFVPYRLKIGYSFDLGGLLANRTLEENLKLPLMYHKTCTSEEADERIHRIALEFGITDQIHERPGALSGGLRKLACVLRAFIIHPEMVVLDDPFTGLGTENARTLIRLMQERRESGELKHVYFTSRDEVWPHWLGCDTLHLITPPNLDPRAPAPTPTLHIESRKAS